MTTHLYAYNQASGGSRELARAMGIRRIRHGQSRYVPGPGKFIINWGAQNMPAELGRSSIINPPNLLRTASNKLNFFNLCQAAGGISIPDFTTDRRVAVGWQQDGATVCARALLNGHSGRGLTIHKPDEQLPQSPLYVKYVPKKEEYRVHIIGTNVVDVQRKIKRPDFQGEPNWQIRNHDGGFIFVRNGINPHPSVQIQALAAFSQTGLDFGAVDVIFNEQRAQSYVLEVNTAPGLTGQTVQTYANGLRNLIDARGR